MAIIWAPLVEMWLQIDKFPSQDENREFAALPEWNWTAKSVQEFPSGFEKYYNDHVGFRDRLVGTNAFLDVFILGNSPSEMVVIGKDGWLFYTGNSVLLDYQGRSIVPDSRWAGVVTTLEEQRDWLAERGCRMIVVIPPNKVAIYPEFLPITVQKGDSPKRIDQFLSYLNSTGSTLDVLYLRDDLLDAKKEGIAYYPPDTHWSSLGAWFGYKRIVSHLGLKPQPLSSFRWYTGTDDFHDLVNMLGLKGIWELEPATLLDKSFPRKATIEQVGGSQDPSKVDIHASIEDPDLPVAMVFGDSFFGALIPFLTEHFQRTTMIRGRFLDRELIEREKPDFVIVEIVERNASSLPIVWEP